MHEFSFLFFFSMFKPLKNVNDFGSYVHDLILANIFEMPKVEYYITIFDSTITTQNKVCSIYSSFTETAKNLLIH